ncbi:MAG: alanine dehydrogenase [Weeksellaceae bacterium]|jgi:alanine dehydrogenase|nr:alanine dehydrogenase [Weeksellaceae bacterium]MDX9705528.1 alanine dehydrogenase [Weeksellaceae bacterium]
MENSEFYSPFSRHELIPKEERLEVTLRKGKLSIGIPKEKHHQEKRIGLSPDAVQVLVANGHKVTIEAGAGEDANYSDQEYSEAGAEISYNPNDVFSKPIILKVSPLTNEEIDLLTPNTFLLSTVQINMQTRAYFEKLSAKKITAIGFEYIQDDHNHLPVVRLLSEIAGTTSILLAGELMANSNGGNGILMGGITGVRPTEVVILGAGTVGEFASRAALGLGANIRVFDNSLSRLRRLQTDLGIRISTSMLDPKELAKSLKRCDVVIGALRGEARTPCVVTEKMVENMKPGAVIIDLSIDDGGCFETSELTTHGKPTVIKHDVIHYGVANITSRVARTTTKALSNFFLHYFLRIGNEGGFEVVIRNDKGLRSGVYVYHGLITKDKISDWFSLPFHDLNLLIV